MCHSEHNFRDPSFLETSFISGMPGDLSGLNVVFLSWKNLSPSLHRRLFLFQTLKYGELPLESRNSTDWESIFHTPCYKSRWSLHREREGVIHTNTTQKASNQAEEIRPRSKQSGLPTDLTLGVSQLHSRRSIRGTHRLLHSPVYLMLAPFRWNGTLESSDTYHIFSSHLKGFQVLDT